MSLHNGLKNLVFLFLRNIYRKIIPKNIREKRWQNIYHKRQRKFYLNFAKHVSKFTQYLDKNAEYLIDEEISSISLYRNNILTVARKYELMRLIYVKGRNNTEQIKILNYLKKNPAAMLSYDFTKKYDYNHVAVYNDNGNKYVLHENKKMYFPKTWEDENIQKYYNGLIYEQDADSPHRYESDTVHVNPGDVVVDIGASEGFFALSVIEKAKKVYLFECDEIWDDVQKMTFAPYKEKVVIVNKYVSDYTDGNTITLDQFSHLVVGIDGGGEINFIKMDIEGMELKALKGCHNLFTANKNIKVAICTYHNENDANDIREILLNNNFQVEFSKGYIISVWEESFSLRKGVIRGYK